MFKVVSEGQFSFFIDDDLDGSTLQAEFMSRDFCERVCILLNRDLAQFTGSPVKASGVNIVYPKPVKPKSGSIKY